MQHFQLVRALGEARILSRYRIAQHPQAFRFHFHHVAEGGLSRERRNQSADYM